MNTYGENIKFSIFGESHGVAIGGVLDGIDAGKKIDFEKIDFLLKRRNHRASYSTQRSESDEYEILSGVVGGVTTGSPIGFIIRNQDTKSNHYNNLNEVMRPSHADYPAFVKFNGFNDVSIHFNIDSTGANTLCFIFHNISSFLIFTKGSIAEKKQPY